MVNSSLRVASDDESGTASISWYLQDLAATKVSVFELYSDVGRMECVFFFFCTGLVMKNCHSLGILIKFY